MSELFSRSLITLNEKVNNEQELFDLIGNRAIKKGIARLGYISGLEKRELAYPTGLNFQNISIALPHVDPKYILKPFVYVVRTTNPIIVKQMGDSTKMSTSNFMFLGLKDGTKQPELLAKIISAFQDKEFVGLFLKASDEKTMYDLLSEYLLS